MAVSNIVERLKPDHLDPEVLKQEAEKSGKADTAAADPRGQEQYTFSFSWTDGRGKVWAGEFTNKVLTIAERQDAGWLRSRLSRGVGPDVLDDFTNELNLILSHLTYSLKKRPAWAEDLTTLQNPRLLQALYEEVLAHEATFLGLRPTP